MDLFNATRVELELLQKEVSYLSLFDIRANELRPILGAPADLPVFSLALEHDFSIGEWAPAPGSSTPHALISELVVDLYERSWLSHMLREVNRPISLNQAPERYFREVAKHVNNATFGRVAILRLFDEIEPDVRRDTLRCAAIDDVFDLSYDLSLFNLERKTSEAFAIYEEFYRTFLNDPGAVLTLRATDNPALFRIGSSLLPEVNLDTLIISALSIGGQLSGFVTIAYEVHVELTEDLRVAFANISNHCAAAIETFRTLNDLQTLRNDRLRTFVETTHIDLIQGFRHAARTALFKAQGHYRALTSYYSYKGRAEDNPYTKLRADLAELDLALNNMASVRMLAEKKEESNLAEVFDEACALMKQHLDDNGVNVRPSWQGDMRLVANRDGIKYAFANMLLNSAQAFRGPSARLDRVITVHGTRANRDIVIDFADNGPGIRLGQGDIHNYEDIWVPGKTSKKDGTGYGLPMVRDIFQRLHNGSIDLKPTSSGTAFRIRLRVDQ